MAKWTGRLRQIISDQEEDQSAQQSHSLDDQDAKNAEAEGLRYLQRVRDKLSRLVDDFAVGRVNRAQFEELYSHYQKERKAIETLLTSRPSSNAWRMAVTEGHSRIIRRRLAARVLGYAVYANHDETALRVHGEFASLDRKWVSPLLSRINRASIKLYSVGSFETGGKEATFLCAVVGEFATLLVLFTTEPARVQIESLEDLHTHFERANYGCLSRGQYGIDDLVFPYAAAFE
jgi:hypothetical protein